jgi:hypothetical protein
MARYQALSGNFVVRDLRILAGMAKQALSMAGERTITPTASRQKGGDLCQRLVEPATDAIWKP